MKTKLTVGMDLQIWEFEALFWKRNHKGTKFLKKSKITSIQIFAAINSSSKNKKQDCDRMTDTFLKYKVTKRCSQNNSKH